MSTPVAPTTIGAISVEQQVGDEGAHHVLRAMREIDDVQQSEDHRQAQRQQRIERAVDQPDQQLAEQGLGGYAEDLGHCVTAFFSEHPLPPAERGCRSDDCLGRCAAL
jgi:glucokinase